MSWIRGAMLAVLTALAAAFGLGYVAFARSLEGAHAPSPLPEADAIVSLTGGTRERLTTGMRLLAEGRGRRLLISGVDTRAPADAVYSLLDGPEDLVACCVDLGRRAKDTLGNASETARWAGRNGFSRIIVVTDDYHMPRSLAELRTALPDAQLIPYPVTTKFSEPGAWKRDLPTAARIGSEYVKYLVIRARSALLRPSTAPVPEPAA